MEFTDVEGLLFDDNRRFSWTCVQTTDEGAAQLNQGKPVSLHCVMDIVFKFVNSICSQ